jgi:hypothetical protein
MASLWVTLTELGTIAWVMIMIVGVVAVHGIVVIVKMWIKHRERMAMIEKGMDPGAAEEAYKKDEI